MKIHFGNVISRIIVTFVVVFACTANSLARADYWQDQQIRNQVNQNTSGDSSGNQYYNGELNSIQNNSSLSPSDKYSQELHVQQESNDRMEEHQAWEYEMNRPKAGGPGTSDDDYVPDYRYNAKDWLNETEKSEFSAYLYDVKPGDTVTATFSQGVSVSVSYTAKQGDNAGSIMSGLVAAMKTNPTLMSADVKVETAFPDWPLSNFTVEFHPAMVNGVWVEVSKTKAAVQTVPVTTQPSSSTVVGQPGASSSAVAPVDSSVPKDSQAATQDVDAQSDDMQPSLIKRIFRHLRHPLGGDDD